MTIEPWLMREPERTLYDYRFAWEGEREQVHQLDGGTAHELAVSMSGNHGMVVDLKLGSDEDTESVDGRLARLLAELETGDRRFVWIIGPSSSPPDLARRLEARGLARRVEWDGMVLDPIPAGEPANPAVTVEPLTLENAEEYAAIISEDAGTDVLDERLAAARRYLGASPREVEIFIGRLAGRAVSAVILRVEPNGVAYLRNAYTVTDARGHGVYSSLVTHRLNVARQAGCVRAVVQANRLTSSPILRKRGFVTVCPIYGYARPAEPGDAASHGGR